LDVESAHAKHVCKLGWPILSSLCLACHCYKGAVPLHPFPFPWQNIMIEATSFADALKKGAIRYSRTTRFIPNLDIWTVDGDGNCFWASISVRASSRNLLCSKEGSCAVLCLPLHGCVCFHVHCHSLVLQHILHTSFQRPLVHLS
jgi:hypothetical protein